MCLKKSTKGKGVGLGQQKTFTRRPERGGLLNGGKKGKGKIEKSEATKLGMN